MNQIPTVSKNYNLDLIVFFVHARNESDTILDMDSIVYFDFTIPSIRKRPECTCLRYITLSDTYSRILATVFSTMINHILLS